jgi:hypothetical protein
MKIWARSYHSGCDLRMPTLEDFNGRATLTSARCGQPGATRSLDMLSGHPPSRQDRAGAFGIYDYLANNVCFTPE